MRKFRIPAIPSTTSKSIRFPNSLIEEVEAAIVGKDSTFSAFVIGATRWALDNLDDGETMPFYEKGRSRHNPEQAGQGLSDIKEEEPGQKEL
ncbi:YlcI/YnfO family protein [Candidatus Soleaferrea massiliensis]|uniref:YlcI/YnfO family protein n=1 Tax=Candidatus Soleaferrea massiliensis TaxID=1470354 RepID=UPI0009E49D4C